MNCFKILNEKNNLIELNNQINEEILNENIAFQNIVNDFINKANYHFPLSAEEYLNLEKIVFYLMKIWMLYLVI